MSKVRGKAVDGLTGDRPPLMPQLETARRVGLVRLRGPDKRRGLLLLSAALISVVFVSGYALGVRHGGSAPRNAVVKTLILRGTAIAPHARARLEVLPARGTNWPITLSVVGLPKLPPRTYYEVDLARGGKPWKSCGSFQVPSASRPVTLTLNAPFALRKGESWLVTRQRVGRETGVGREGGVTALRQV